MKKSIGGVLSVLCLLMLLFNPGLALEGARQGLVLWGNVVLPTLLPFMICSGVIVAMDAIHILTGPFKPILSGILSLSDQGSFCLMSGLLCGYPMGAKTTSADSLFRRENTCWPSAIIPVPCLCWDM